MSYEQFTLTYEALSPISHGGDSPGGNENPLNKIKVTVEEDGESFKEDVPIISGNSVRGILRDRVAYDYLDQLDVQVGDALAYALYSGGYLDRGGGKIDRRLREQVRENIPMLSVFGTALQSEAMRSKLDTGIVFPIASETENYTGIPSDESVAEYQDTISYTRLDDLKEAGSPEIRDTLKEDAVQTAEDADRAQMKRNRFRVLAPGTPFKQDLTLRHATDVERGVVGRAFDLFEENPVFGARSAVGHGRVAFEFEEDRPDATPYLEYLEDNRDDLREYVTELDAQLS